MLMVKQRTCYFCLCLSLGSANCINRQGIITCYVISRQGHNLTDWLCLLMEIQSCSFELYQYFTFF